ncbi:tRNA pseudouridine synthase A-like isoform X2 [Anneissia japonica]|uniref:tRNA pseudouridine synthase A-like isoform X2 n=1 Tax=Anneissia japonica TaxID=1529436 RepID=UPI0014258A19|nr:tRNA pseudouridine synthase A-like isoform X2 [Anneissia japonica]
MLRKVQGLLQQLKIWPALSKMAEIGGVDTASGKRPVEDEKADQEVKKQKTEDASTSEPKKVMKRKVAILLSYSGVGYKGMQINKGFKTIEDELFKAMTKAEAVTESMAEHIGKMSFQRCARTDKGVSAAGQVVSMKMYLLNDVVDRINQHLPAQIRVMDIVRTMGIFSSWRDCDERTYIYVLPTYAFSAADDITIDTYRFKDETIKEVNRLLQYYHGSKNFHNFTSGKKFKDPSAYRFIKDFTCSEPFMQDGMEFTTLRVRGQSFMLHQIRKMVGLVLAVIRGLAEESVMKKVFEGDKLDIPKAPGLGLVLESVHYEHYNEKWGSDGLHEPLVWDSCKDKVEAFKRDFIYPTIINTEKEERTMLTWLGTLPLHSYGNVAIGVPMMEARKKLDMIHKAEMEEKESTDSTPNISDSNENATEQSKTEEESTAAVVESQQEGEECATDPQNVESEEKIKEEIAR